MDRRQLLAGLSASVLMGQENRSESKSSYLEVSFWRLHNTGENQAQRVSAYLEHGLAPGLARSGAKVVGAFSTIIGPESPCFVTVTQYASLAAMEEAVMKLKSDRDHQLQVEKLGSGSGLPFVRVDSSLLRSFDVLPDPNIMAAPAPGRVFELRTYESQTFATLTRKVGMFNDAEAKIFERLGFRPVFFGETIVGPNQPNLMYMLSYENLAARDQLWHSFSSDPEWKRLSGEPALKDSEIVANISNRILSPLPFSPTR
ncbi:MAG TPA: NIPSNAP family protein [Bryobacteraceae bacterium]|nr:NIPSNAP family protein [Bryobacteraceae bacterium]